MGGGGGALFYQMSCFYYTVHVLINWSLPNEINANCLLSFSYKMKKFWKNSLKEFGGPVADGQTVRRI